MSEDISNALARGIQILECLFDNDFQGKTEMEICKQTGIPLTTTFRHLKMLKSVGWAEDFPVEGSKTKIWKVNGSALVKTATKYQESALRRVQAIEKEFLEVTGKELRR
ncbi:MAG: hypothetical protein BVN35_20345 [Proteobacteria bacterium ST_bin11]|nr:MAG: hypothetical protein BVN35_20345 [Proteobacteria bacterium ST_bin11]